MDLRIPTSLTGASAALDHASQSSAKPNKLHEAAQQFESLMINEMMKSVKESSSSGWMGSEDEGDPSGGSAMEMAQSQFATALAKSGGLGLAHMIETTVSGQSSHLPAVSPK